MVVYPSLNFYEWMSIGVVYLSLNFYEWMSISILFFHLLLNILFFVYERISFIYIVHIISYGFKCGPSTHEGI